MSQKEKLNRINKFSDRSKRKQEVSSEYIYIGTCASQIIYASQNHTCIFVAQF